MPSSRIYTSQLTATAVANNAILLLQAVEQYPDSINTWPSCIIFSLFAETPSPCVIKYLTDFSEAILCLKY